METVTFYFSFRSPYAWLAYHRIHHALGDLGQAFERVPVFPPPGFANTEAAVPAKLEYLKQDVARIAGAYGLPVRWPEASDTNWMRPHAAYLHARDAGRGDAFALALYAARFGEGRDIGDDATLAAIATHADLDPKALVAAADDATRHQQVLAGMQRALGDGIFGVPFFVFRGGSFWGNDRLEWVLRELAQAGGGSVPDLRGNLLARPC